MSCTTEVSAPGDRPRAAAGAPHFACVRHRPSGDQVRVSVAGELDIATLPELDVALTRAQADAPNVIVELQDLEFMDSSGVHLLMDADQRIRRSGGRLMVAHPVHAVQRLFRLIGVDLGFEIVDPTTGPPGRVTRPSREPGRRSAFA